MELGKKYIKKLLAGVEDLLLDATFPYQVIQIRGGQSVTVTKINIDTIPAVGKYGQAGFQSVRNYIDNKIAELEGITDELVKVNSQDTSAGYLFDKVDTTQFEVAFNRIKIKDSVLKIESMNDLHIESRNNGYALFWDETLNKYVHKAVTLDGLTSEDFLKLNQSNPQTITNGVPLLDFEITASSNVLSLVNKKYVDFAVASAGTLRYYLSGITNSYGAYEIYLSEPQSDTYSFSFTNVDDGDLLLSFETNVLEIDKIYAGVLNLIVNAQKTSGTQDVRLYWKLKGRDSSGNLSVILSESDESDELKNSMSVENIPITIVDDIDISGYDSLVIELYAKVSGWGSSPDIEISVGNNTNTTFTLPIPAEGLTALYALKTLENVSDSDFLNKILDVDGDGSGIDADTVDGKHASEFATKVSGATEGNLVSLNSEGNIIDSGIKAIDWRKRLYFNIDWQSDDRWTHSSSGSAGYSLDLLKCSIWTGTTVNSREELYTGIIPNYNLHRTNQQLFLRLQRGGTTFSSVVIYAGVWDYSDNPPLDDTKPHIGWKIVDGAIYASVGDGTNVTQVDTGVTFFDSNWNARDLAIIAKSNSEIEFYVDDVLKTTITTNIPTFTNGRLYFSIENGTSEDQKVFVEHILGIL